MLFGVEVGGPAEENDSLKKCDAGIAAPAILLRNVLRSMDHPGVRSVSKRRL
jgi:hypothetical protein